jgi:hypothetical protein
LIDLGLRLEDVEKMQLQSEPVEFEQIKHPGQKLLDYGGITRDEIDFLVEVQVDYKQWRGKRVELNAMTSAQFINRLEGKFDEHGVTKVIPDEKTLENAWCRARVLAKIMAAVVKIKTEPDTERMPADLAKRLRKLLNDEPVLSGPGPSPHCREARLTQRSFPDFEADAQRLRSPLRIGIATEGLYGSRTYRAQDSP